MDCRDYLLRRLLVAGAAMALCRSVPAHASQESAYPSWWSERGVLAAPPALTNDFAAVNVGQLKWMALKAFEELEARLPEGAGTELAELIDALPATNNYGAVNVGQVKRIADPFYDRLQSAGYAVSRPWTTATSDDNDWALANVGQVKSAFGFSLDDVSADTDGDGLDDLWELENFGGLHRDGSLDADGDGLTDAQEAAAGSDPTLYDSDGDGVSDGLDPSGGTSDSDGDGLPDDWEEHWFGNLVQGGDDDPDLDGALNSSEWARGTDPTRANLTPADTALTLAIFECSP